MSERTPTEVLRFLADRAEIQDLLYRYCRGVDRCDPALVRSAYHPDSFDERGYWRGNGHEFAVFITDRLRSANTITTHSVTNALIELTGDEATSESQVRATLVRRDSAVADVIGARYLDRLSRRGGTWRIDHRTVVLDWRTAQPGEASEAPFPTDGFQRGSQCPDDPVYALLGRPLE
ncbi:nuclear transport factor 2 family protein [Amycolatopsis sp. Poz14]|uniref:nuclear transport factor 2 family protein n=1 Tax=Amycolatopsis sp. Poz14 TaxID=1447705 RepID=UPI001EE8CAE6|nr:nuclear transport factor 2 family protein [Amycolatopsis sp. Poz14]MCG3753994.1 nuclear transport factor 2 family protein [Amycolatopsis sp. Poz14]